MPWWPKDGAAAEGIRTGGCTTGDCAAGIVRGAEKAGPDDGACPNAGAEPPHKTELETIAPTNSAWALRTNTSRVMDVFRTGCYAKPTFIHAVEACTRSMGLFALGVLRGQREVESDWDFHADRWVSIGVSTLRQSLKQLPCPMHFVRQF